MYTPNPSKSFAAVALILSLLPTAHAEVSNQVTPPTAVQIAAARAQLQQYLTYKLKLSIEEQTALKLQAIQYLASILGTNPLQVAQTKQIDPLAIQDLSQLETTPEEQRLIKIWARMVEDNTLKKNIGTLINELKSTPSPIAAKLASVPQAQQDYAINALTSSIEAVVKMRSLTSDSRSASYREWNRAIGGKQQMNSLSEEITLKINKAEGKDTLALAGSEWVRTEKVEVLVNGKASFDRRDSLMKAATKSINILTWSIYDDVTGNELVELLLAKRKENRSLPIRVIIDGQVSMTSGHGDNVAKLEKAGIEVIRWFNTKLSYVGQHRKMIVIDDQHLIAGGLNYGDVYSHKNPDEKVLRWRDTDIYAKGAGALQGNQLFASLWNQQIEERRLKQKKMLAAPVVDDAGGVEFSVINNDPTKNDKGSTIMLTMLKAIREAKHMIDIENAYIILFPALKQEIQNAIKRNVQVRVLTNSGTSVDEPVVSIPILRSVAEFSKMGAKVYVKKGATLHSKFFAVDSQIAMIMSYNLHPRSERVEGEMSTIVRDTEFAKTMHAVFDNDISEANATEIKSPSDVQISKSAVSVPTLRIFFDML